MPESMLLSCRKARVNLRSPGFASLSRTCTRVGRFGRWPVMPGFHIAQSGGGEHCIESMGLQGWRGRIAQIQEPGVSSL